MEQEEKPVPTEARHRTLGPVAGQAPLSVSAEMPLRFGHRHWGQSAAGELDRAKSKAPSCKHQPPKKHQGTNPKIQTPKSKNNPNSKFQSARGLSPRG